MHLIKIPPPLRSVASEMLRCIHHHMCSVMSLKVIMLGKMTGLGWDVRVRVRVLGTLSPK